MRFNLDPKSEIVLYGVSSMAVSWMEKMTQMTYRIKMFIDKDADKIKSVKNIPVVTLDAYLVSADKNDVVIVMLQNVMWHKEIAERLMENGIKKIVFFPMQEYCWYGEISLLRKRYNQCIKNRFENILSDIPIIEKKELFGNNTSHIYMDDYEVTAWAPVEICFSIKDIKESGFWKTDRSDASIQLAERLIFDRNLFNLYPYYELYDFLKGKKESCPLYLKMNGKEGHINSDKCDNDTLLCDRRKLMDIFEEEIHRGTGFFEESPAFGIVNRRLGKIMIQDGMHRSIFLVDHNFWWIPICMNKEDYAFLYNADKVNKVKEFFIEHGVTELEYPVEGLGFYGLPVQHRCIRQIWKFASQAISSIGWRVKSVLDLSMTDGYFSRMFYRDGVDKIHCYIGNDSELPMMINQFFRIDDIIMILNQECLPSLASQCELVIINWDKLEELGPIRLGSQYMQIMDKLLVYGICMEEEGKFRSFLKNRNKVLVNKYIDDGKLKCSWLIY